MSIVLNKKTKKILEREVKIIDTIMGRQSISGNAKKRHNTVRTGESA